MKHKLKKLIYMVVIGTLLAVTIIPVSAKKDFTICIDPGHQAKGDPKG